MKSILICGSRGYPAHYGGFETLTQELSELWSEEGLRVTVTGFSGKGTESVLIKNELPKNIRTINVKFSGWFRIANLIATFKAARIACSHDEFDGAIVLNDVNFFTAWYLQEKFAIPVVIHLDGDESARRGIPWPGRVLHWAMRVASIIFIDKIVVDSRVLLKKFRQKHLHKVTVIKYGSPRVSTNRKLMYQDSPELNEGYFLNVARFVPENNVAEIIEAYLNSKRQIPLVILGKGTGSKKYESKLEDLAMRAPGKIRLMEAQYDRTVLCTLIQDSILYIHGHEAGGTNPVLITARQLATFVASHNNSYNREDCRSDEEFWSDVTQLTNIMNLKSSLRLSEDKATIPSTSSESWAEIADQYLDALLKIKGK